MAIAFRGATVRKRSHDRSLGVAALKVCKLSYLHRLPKVFMTFGGLHLIMPGIGTEVRGALICRYLLRPLVQNLWVRNLSVHHPRWGASSRCLRYAVWPVAS
jgi:hypothetical protein